MQSCEPKPTQKLQTRGSDSLSLEDCGTPMVSAASHATDGGGNPSDSENSETTAANLTNNPYALVDEDGVGLSGLSAPVSVHFPKHPCLWGVQCCCSVFTELYSALVLAHS